MSSEEELRNQMILAEYSNLWQEIRQINTKIATFMGTYLTMLAGLFGYLAFGSHLLSSYDPAKSDTVGRVVIFSVLGILLIASIHIAFVYAFRQYSVSRRHRVRYWKAIHKLRQTAQKVCEDLCPSLEEAFLLPSADTNTGTTKSIVRSRPYVSRGEFMISYLAVAVDITVALLMVFFLQVLIPAVCGDRVLFSRVTFGTACATFLPMLTFLGLLTPAYCRHTFVNLASAAKTSFADPYFAVTKAYRRQLETLGSGRDSLRRAVRLASSIPLICTVNMLLVWSLGYDYCDPLCWGCFIAQIIFALLGIMLYGMRYLFPYWALTRMYGCSSVSSARSYRTISRIMIQPFTWCEGWLDAIARLPGVRKVSQRGSG